ncbi:putative sporulation protein YtxC [Fictibacillus gelatini]|uniref:putative sporulation protein YtxC n=1 Tax=Fictibacillus gelatini TaxID=225985 RepID=UPI000478E470|nr:putative sporulation protein YtxC [Fictibacillus gelatini]
MIELIFTDQEECYQVRKKICNQASLKQMNPSFVEVLHTDPHILHIKSFEHMNVIIDIVAGYIQDKVEEDHLLYLIENVFFFKDKDEQQEILVIAKSIMNGEIEDIPGTSSMVPGEQLIKKELSKLFLENRRKFTIDSFIQFRLKDYFQQLLMYVEWAIDEYKMELEYQSFIDHLRTCVSTYQTKVNAIHVTFDGEIRIYDEVLNPFSSEKLEKMYEKALVMTEELDLDRILLGPLLGISPKMIYFYSNEADHAIVHTIQNIFEERLIHQPLSSFAALKQRINSSKT